MIMICQVTLHHLDLHSQFSNSRFVFYISYPIIGLFNACNKILIGIDILIEWREYFKTGMPLNNLIEAKLQALQNKTQKVTYILIYRDKDLF